MRTAAGYSVNEDGQGASDRSLAVVQAFRHYVANDGADLPQPGSGRTWTRFEGLKTCAAGDLSVGRLVEGHVDALAILAEAGRTAGHRGAAYGVWAAFSGSDDLEAEPIPGGWRLRGSKPFCSGSSTVQRALVTARTSDGPRLFDIDVADHVASSGPDSWPAVGMADSDSQTLTFDGPVVAHSEAIGGPGFYTARPGFWFGAVGVAACWYGGAVGLVDHLLATLPPEPGEHVLADLGRAVARISAMRDVLFDAARGIDADPYDVGGTARFRAFTVRQTIHDGSIEVLTATATAGGARPLCHHRSQARRAADLYVYLAQHHGGADAAEIGRMALGGRSWS